MTERTREDLTSQQMEVIAAGEPSYCDDEACERQHLPSIIVEHRHGKRHRLRTHTSRIHAGDWVLVAHRSLLETDQDGIYVVSQDDILAVIQP